MVAKALFIDTLNISPKYITFASLVTNHGGQYFFLKIESLVVAKKPCERVAFLVI